MAAISSNSYDYKAVETVPVIASFDRSGRIVPLYVRLGRDSYKVQSCWASRKHGGIEEFHCRVVDGSCLKPLLLTYYKDEDVWAVPGHALDPDRDR